MNGIKCSSGALQCSINQNKEGISLISLIITIIVIIILAAIVIFNGLNAPNSAQFAGFVQQVDNVQMAVNNKFGELKTKHSIAGHYRTDEQIYIEIAVAEDPGQYATMSTVGTPTNHKATSGSIGDSTGIQRIVPETSNDKTNESSLGMTLPKVRESNNGWYVTKEGRVFNANGYAYDGKTYFTGAVYQAGVLAANDTTNDKTAGVVYSFIARDENVVTGATRDGSAPATTGGATTSPTSTPADTITVTFDVDGGSPIASRTITSGQTITKPADPTKDGFTFDNWYSDSGKTSLFNFSNPITSDTTIYAKWIAEPSGPVITNVTHPSGALAVGDEITVSGESFYYLWDKVRDNVTNAVLIAKYNLKTDGTAQDPNKAYGDTAVRFSQNNGWPNTNGFNLNTYSWANTETASNNAVLKARAYVTRVGGTNGRLLEYDEANNNYNHATLGDIIKGKANQHGAGSSSYYLRYWLGSALDTSYVWIVSGSNSRLSRSTYSDGRYYGVRPVMEILKSRIPGSE